jgi:hypothetical protein
MGKTPASVAMTSPSEMLWAGQAVFQAVINLFMSSGEMVSGEPSVFVPGALHGEYHVPIVVVAPRGTAKKSRPSGLSTAMACVGCSWREMVMLKPRHHFERVRRGDSGSVIERIQGPRVFTTLGAENVSPV